MPKNTAERIIDRRVGNGGYVTAGAGRTPVAGPDGLIALEWIPQGEGSGLDADKLDGQHAAAFAAASHDHDDRYYTESETDTLLGGYVLKATFDDNSMLYATDEGTPVALSVGASTIVGRGAAGGIAALSAGDARTVLGLATTNTVQFDQVQAIRDGGQGAFFVASYRDAAIGSLIQMASARGSVATPAVSQQDDRVGWFGAYGYSAAAAAFRTCAAVAFFIDGEPDTSGDTTDMPGRIVFQTAPDGSTTLTDRVTIKSNGNVGINKTSPGSKLAVVGLTDYANNAAAIAGGLSAGDFYTETGTNPKRVCVVY